MGRNFWPSESVGMDRDFFGPGGGVETTYEQVANFFRAAGADEKTKPIGQAHVGERSRRIKATSVFGGFWDR